MKNIDKNRITALEALIEIDQKSAYSNIAISKAIKRRKPDFPAFVREIVYGVLENRRYIDYILQHFIKTPVSGMSKVTVNILRVGVYQMAFIKSIPAYAVVNESVKAAQQIDRGKDKFVNAVLRRYLREKDEIKLPDQKDEMAYLTIRYSYDESILALWQKEFCDRQAVEALMAAGNKKPPVVIRANLLKTTANQLAKELEQEGFFCVPGNAVPESLRILADADGGAEHNDADNGAANDVASKEAGGIRRFESPKCEKSGRISVKRKELTKTEAFVQGRFYIQDESSMLAVCMVDPKPGETIVDVCAAPGGKSVFIGERMKNKGRIIAFDLYEHKLKQVIQTAVRHGISIIETKQWDSTQADESLVGKADRVIADVPCSGLGVIRRHPEIKYKNYDVEFSGLPAIQSRILQAAAQYVKPGGVLVYSTCTISYAENFGVIETFLKENQEFALEKDEVLQLIPSIHDTDGFCVFKMTKVQETKETKKEMTDRTCCGIIK